MFSVDLQQKKDVQKQAWRDIEQQSLVQQHTHSQANELKATESVHAEGSRTSPL